LWDSYNALCLPDSHGEMEGGGPVGRQSCFHGNWYPVNVANVAWSLPGRNSRLGMRVVRYRR
jgi:hypothetical protein